ncbi:cystin-1 [Candoia aspera]|uniref:cystin-1 n=1 Tax=Candoia aspera TaxID=51853 RepID=UPI002FD855D5
MDPILFGHRPPGLRNSWALESEQSGKQSGAAKRPRATAAARKANAARPLGTPAAMGTGSSRAGKTRSLSPPRRWLGPGWGSASHSAPSRQGPTDDEGAARARAAGQTPARAPALPLEPPDSDSELLDQVLEECDEDSPQLLSLPLPPPPPRRPPRHDAGDSCSRPTEGSGEEAVGRREKPEGFLARSTPESNNFANQLPLKKPERQAKISYDYSEEELMATIEQEYCR